MPHTGRISFSAQRASHYQTRFSRGLQRENTCHICAKPTMQQTAQLIRGGTRLKLRLCSLNTARLIHPFLQCRWSQTSCIPRHSSDGGAGGDPTGRTPLFYFFLHAKDETHRMTGSMGAAVGRKKLVVSTENLGNVGCLGSTSYIHRVIACDTLIRLPCHEGINSLFRAAPQ